MDFPVVFNMNTDYEKLLERVRETLPEDTGEHERFQMPTAKSFIQGNKTLMNNIGQVADYLNRDIQHLLKFLLKELATSGILEGSKAIFTGKFPKKVIDEKLILYVNTYVKCRECGSPDTKFDTTDKILMLHCIACQAKRPLPRVK